ncbi:hypothetical protein HHK36_010393 [Tetracentron sinense]|uniref:Pseudouridine synthase I TruA alpha/beta domain-containing protein n=1 Tax=Tetracentron sinense TaxID=13715 RepID=A0A834ZKQ8_TETSI|nr:hypothetical protein HHK36_010393 [Tetracentron sinense]
MEPSPPSPQEPEPKKLKMSTTTTTTSDDDCNTKPTSADPNSERKPRYKRRKIAIFFAYCGVGYQGMQKNPGAKTIEADLEEALFFSGAVPESDRGHPKRFDWARSARTDKGVSAVGQVVSGRFYIDPPGFVDRLNSNLSPQIRIFGFKRVTASFNAKKFCDRRRYVYLIPVFALDPSSHPDRESVLASFGSETELAKCLECSERGRKVFGLMGRRNSESRVAENGEVSVESRVSSEICSAVLHSDMTVVSNIDSNNAVSLSDSKLIEEPRVSSNNGESGTSYSDSKEEPRVSAVVLHSELTEEPRFCLDEEKTKLGGCNNGEEMPAKGSEFSYGEKEKERFNRILKHYVGTHNFHNLTTRTKAEDPSAQRFIISFVADTVINVEGIDFIKCEVVGQSFMLHQIRKMIGLAVAIMRNCAPESLIDTALEKDVNITVPTAPEVGLYLDECFFTSYNQKWKDTHEEVSMKAYAEEAEDFKMKQIYSHIASTEQKEGVVALWLHSLNHRNYPDLCYVKKETYTNGESTQVGNMVE